MSGITKTDYESIAKILSGPVKDRLEELEHQDVYEDIVNALADKFGEEFDNFDADKFINAT